MADSKSNELVFSKAIFQQQIAVTFFEMWFSNHSKYLKIEMSNFGPFVFAIECFE